MKRIKHFILREYNYAGWFATAVLTISAVALILLICHVVTPIINSLAWGMH